MTGRNSTFIDAVIHQRKSVRNYTGELVDLETLHLLVKAGMAAPSGRNQQPWAFIILNEPDLLVNLTLELPYAKMLAQAGSGIVVCGYSADPNRPGGKDLWEQDCAAATENILLAAESLNLGGVWTALHPYPERQAIVRKWVSIPENIFPFSLIPIGKPTGADQPKLKHDPSKIHVNRW